MGAAGSRPGGQQAERGFPQKLRGQSTGSLPDALGARSWKRLLSYLGTVMGLEQALAASNSLKPEQARVGEKPPAPPHASLFLPEFPVQSPMQQLKILGFLAKGTFGTVLKVLDCTEAKIFALKVVPKAEVLRRDGVRQCKEEVRIQRQVCHPFLHCLGDSWQGQHHLFIRCSYYSAGDLFTLWKSEGPLAEGAIRLFATELVLVLAYLHNQGILHRDIKMENILLDEQGHLKLADFGLSRHLPQDKRAFTICGTLQYMAPEVLRGGPYAHAADWWSLGVLLFAMATGKFPVPPEQDHVAMLQSMKRSTYSIPPTLGRGLRLLLIELLCWDPQRRLCHLHQFRTHLFFHGMSFDAAILRKQPADFVLGWQQREGAPVDTAAFSEFDCDLGDP